MKSKFFNQKFIMKLCMMFLIMQPILDIYIFFEPAVVEFFHFSPSTIIRILFMGVIALLLFFTMKWEKKHLWMIVYFLLVGIYVVFHHWNATKFHSQIDGDFSYSIVSELFYIIRMILPLAMIFIAKQWKMGDQKLQTLMRWLIVLVSGSIFVSNLLLISKGSYTNKVIDINILMWFLPHKNPYSYLEVASKGFFMYANQIAALELLLTPIWYYVVMKRPNKMNIVLTVVHICAMFMIGTKVANLGIVLLTGLTLVVYHFFVWAKKELEWNKKIFLWLSVFLVLCIFIYPYSPSVDRTATDGVRKERHHKVGICEKLEYTLPQTKYKISMKKYKTASKKEKCPTIEILEQQKIQIVKENLSLLQTENEKKAYLISFIKKEYPNYGFVSTFIEDAYPYEQDPYFWLEQMEQPLMVRTNFRYLEKSMLEHVKQYNQRKLDDVLGITYVRMSNIFNLERDFVSHYYTLGFVGLILFLSPYILIVLYAIGQMLLHPKKCITFYHTMLLMAFGITLFAAFYSGNVMDGLVVTLLLGFMMGQLLKSISEKNKTVEEKKKVSIIMPTYNDCTTITETLDSVLEQTYQNWELCIIDDGSSDDTKKVIETYRKEHDLEDKISYTYQENQDQLRAIIHGTELITGDYVFVLHSDDLFANPDVLKNSVMYMEEHPMLDAIIADLIIINEHSKVTGRQTVLDYHKNQKNPVIQLLWLGRNLFVDVGFYKRESYVHQIKENYLIWNTPFWLTTKEKVEMLDIEKVDFEFLKYRVHGGNYIHNEVGKLNVLNGELRTVTRLMHFYEIPNYEKQYIMFRVMMKLGLFHFYKPRYLEKPTEQKAEVLDFVIRKRFPDGYDENPFLKGVVRFYQKKKKRSISFSECFHGEHIYQGNEMRMFHKQLLEGTLPSGYQMFMKEMEQGFDEIIVTNDQDYENAMNLIQFFCLYPDVRIMKKESRRK